MVETRKTQDASRTTPHPPSAKIIVRDLNLYYERMRALRDVSVEINDHEITALIGPSGCGKSSFLRCLNRMNDLIRTARVEGKVWMDGVDIYDKNVDVVELRKRVGMVFQKPNPFPMSVFDNIAYGPRLHGVPKRELPDIVEQSLRAAALWDEVKDKLRQSAMDLSGGQQQRLCIARCLAVDPEVILLDEPCSALDPISTFRIEELLLQLKQRLAIVLVTHNMFQASRIADRTGFFLDGELIEIGATVDIFERPRDARTDGFVRGRFG
ncbi:MAG: phosphate ABC transporter ATP-binding protein PstB [Abditibacteriales bacterium]|nr:phosphate ABC transporter ATP-binding protein PstB [Abditibacteriales bacterium]